MHGIIGILRLTHILVVVKMCFTVLCLINNTHIDWRKFAYRLNIQLFRKIKRESEIDITSALRCLIVDDTDLSKTGRCFELVGRIYSHVTHSSKLGFKGLFYDSTTAKFLFIGL